MTEDDKEFDYETSPNK